MFEWLDDKLMTGPNAHKTPREVFYATAGSRPTLQGCWDWSGKQYNNGYGEFKSRFKGYLVHRLSYYLEYGAFDPNLVVCHKCDNRLCINPEHLFLGTHTDNMQDMIKKGRQGCRLDEKCGMSKLTETEVHEIFRLKQEGKLHREISEIFGVSTPQITRILNGQRWPHIYAKYNN